jgi:hypothetical protein
VFAETASYTSLIVVLLSVSTLVRYFLECLSIEIDWSRSRDRISATIHGSRVICENQARLDVVVVIQVPGPIPSYTGLLQAITVIIQGFSIDFQYFDARPAHSEQPTIQQISSCPHTQNADIR